MTRKQSSGIRTWVADHPLVAYVALAYLVSWGWWVPFVVAGDLVEQGVGWPTQFPGLLGPLIAAVIVTALAEGRAGLGALWGRMGAWRAGWWWLSVPAILGAGAVGLAFSTRSLDSTDLVSYSGIGVSVGTIVTILIVFFVNGFGEEAGWRGFAVDRLLVRHSLASTSLIVAVMWSIWHAPLFFLMESFKGFGVGGTIGWVVGLTAGSVVLTWLYRGSRRSILLVAAWHTAFNFTSATPAASGTVAAISSTVVMVAAVIVLIVDWRGQRAVLAPDREGVKISTG
jgi:membrane protease YdiL (CAAX protease family)